MSTRTTFATCTICEATCGIQVETEERRITSLRGDAADPFSRGHVCPKAIGLRDLQQDPLIHAILRRDGLSLQDLLQAMAEGRRRLQPRGAAAAASGAG